MATQEQISAAARVLSDRSADACNIDRDDNWNMHADEFIEDATAALEAAQAQQAAVEPRGLFVDLIAQHQGLADKLKVALPPVEGDKLPAVGTRVFIHLARSDAWVLHTVVGYYVWPSLSRGGNWRVFVRVKDDDGHLNARALDDIQLTQL